MSDTGFDAKVKIQQVIQNHLPEYLTSEFPKVADFLKQYYVSQEYQGGSIDIVENLDQYLKTDNLTYDILNNVTDLSSDINETTDTIVVTSTKGYPSRYGLLKINDEIITYTGITTNTFTGCIRGFSGVTGYDQADDEGELTFSTSSASSHEKDSKVVNLSVLFLKEFYKKLKYSLTPGLESVDFYKNVEAGNFIKSARSFYQAKGTEESIKILFKVLYGIDPKIVNLEDYLIKPSSARYNRVEVVSAELVSGENPFGLIGQTIIKSTDPSTKASVSNIEIFTKKLKSYYKISLFVGYSENDLIEGVFTIPGKTKVLEDTPVNSTIISVDSTIGFPVSGTVVCGNNVITYADKTINQFLNCSGIEEPIPLGEDLRFDEVIYGFEDGNQEKKVEFRITASISTLDFNGPTLLASKNDKVSVKNIGQIISNPEVDKSKKQVFANSWIYNTSSTYQIRDISGSIFYLSSQIDKSSLKVGDIVDIIFTKDKTVASSNATVVFVNEGANQINLDNIGGFIPLPNTQYSLRRKLNKAYSNSIDFSFGNKKIISDVQNLYVDRDNYGYVSANSLPSYEIKTNLIFSETPQGYNTEVNEYFQGYLVNEDLYSIIAFNSSVSFITGDKISYQPENEALSGLDPNEVYYVEVLEPKNRIKLYLSRSFIQTENFVKFKTNESPGYHRFVLFKDRDRKIGPQKILKKFPIEKSLYSENKIPTEPGSIGMLVNGVEIYNYKSGDKIYYGPLDSISVINGGSNFDVVNPPELIVDPPANESGTNALAVPVMKGSIVDVLVDPQDFGIEKILSLTITGGNGKGTILSPIIDTKSRELILDARDVYDGGGLDIENEAIAFQDFHNLRNGDEIIYSNNGNPSIGIGNYQGSNVSQNKFLSNGARYFVKVLNSKSVQIYPTRTSYNLGINTVGFTTVNNGGIHKFRTIPAKNLRSVKIVDPGTGFENRKLYVSQSGISSYNSIVTFKNHNFNNGEIIEYSSTGNIISGLSTTNSYYILKVDNDSFRLSDAGIGATITENFEKQKYVTFNNTGSGYHIFKYPDIKIDVKVAYADTFTDNKNITITPVIKGSISQVYLYNKGSGYGSNISNFQKSPNIKVNSGENAEVRPIVKDGRITKVNVLYSGEKYTSVPDLVVSGDGVGCILRAVIKNKKLSQIIVINSGTGYSQDTTAIDVVSSGSGSIFYTSVRELTVNNNRFGSELLAQTNKNNLQYSVISYNNELYNLFKEDPLKHSPIIGWAYDGNPIYGPYGYSNPNQINSEIKRMKSGYFLDSSNLEDRPSGFDYGFFIQDYKFSNEGDLDIYNGRYCKTPEFPEGTYAYFASTIQDEFTSNLIGFYPYFVGDYYRSEILKENRILDQYFDFNSSDLSRNTFPYKINQENADNEFLPESNEVLSQSVEVESITKGFVEGLTILNNGKDYKVGDICVFENSTESGGGLNAVVSEVEGIDIVDITTNIEFYNNVVFEWDSGNVIANYFPYHNLLNQDYVFVTGVTTSLSSLRRSNPIQVEKQNVTLLSSLSLNLVSNQIEDIVISPIPSYLKPGDSIKIETEILPILNIFEEQSVVRVKRQDVGFAHTAPLPVNTLPSKFKIKTKNNVKYFDSKINKKVYFNPSQSVGIGTTPGVSISRNYLIKDLSIPISVNTQTIYIPNHPFQNGEEVILQKRAGSASLIVSNNADESSFNVPSASSNSEKLYVINKSKNYIGLATQKDLAQTTSGLFFLSPIPNSYDYLLETNYINLTGNVSKVNSRVSVSTYHNLISGDTINLNVIPNISVGIGYSDIVRVTYNDQIKKLLVNPLEFSSSSVNTDKNTITISDHGCNTGDKIFYSSQNGVISGLTTGNYYVYKVDDNNIQLAETYFESTFVPPRTIKFATSGGSEQKISLVNPPINVFKNCTLVFDVSDSSLIDHDFKFYSGKNLDKEYYGVSSDNQTVIGIGTVGLPESKFYLKYDDQYQGNIFYSLEKNGQVVVPDIDVSNAGKIEFLDSVYNGTYKVYGIGSTTFNINLTNYPERNNHTQKTCDILKYQTNSNNVKGGISKLNILNRGYSYDSLPKLKEIISDEGKNASIVPYSSNIGNINQYRTINQGFEYYSDKTLRPEAYIYPVIFLKNSNQVVGIDILKSGTGYAGPPNLIVKNSETKEIIDSKSVSCKTPYGSVSEVEIKAPIYGLSSAEHEIICIDNSNGVGINSISTSLSGVATCVLVTPVLNGFLQPPFSIGDEIFVENIVNETGTGYNSADYSYEFFKVISYENTNPAVLQFDVSGLSTNPGIAKTFQSGFASIINKKNYPIFKVNQDFSTFLKNEPLLVSTSGLNGQFFETDLLVEESKKDYIKISGNFVYDLKPEYILKGKSSGVKATVSQIVLNEAKFNVDYSNKQNNGWSNDTGKINELYQVIPDNDYYQNLSYSIKSPIEFSKFINPVNRLVHTSGLKNFGDLQLEETSKNELVTSSSSQTIIIDVSNEARVDIIKDYLFVTDYDVFTDSNNVQKSKFLRSNKSLTDYIQCISNRVLPIDDVSKKFANKENERNLFTDVYEYVSGDVYSKYLIQVIDITNNNYSLEEIVTFINPSDDVYTFQRSILNTSSNRLGEFFALKDDLERKILRFTPADPYDTDYDIKLIQTEFSSLDPSPNIGINTLSIGNIDLMGRSAKVGIGSTATILRLQKDNISSFIADLYIYDTVKFNVNIVEIVVNHDGENTYISEYYVDDKVGVSTDIFGTFESKIESDQLYLNIYNNKGTEISVNGRIVGFGKTTSGIGTSRFLIPGQPPESERSGRYQSDVSIVTGISTVVKLFTDLESSFKSFVRISCGSTVAIHQVLFINDKENTYVEQYPFLTIGDSSGIGTFGGEYNGIECLMKFYPDSSYENEELVIQSYSEIFYTLSDYENESLGFGGANTIKFDNVTDYLKLAAYDGLNGPRANRLDFDARYNGIPIYKKIFNPSNTINFEDNILNIRNHFFNTGEKLVYTPVTTFIGVGNSAIGIGETINSSGITTNLLPSDVYAIRINEDQLQLATTKDFALAGAAVSFTSSGLGNAHELEMTKKIEKSVISIDGIVQKPLSFTKVIHQVVNNGGQVSAATSFFSLSGISTIQPTDVLKVNDEYMLVISTGIGTTSIGPITPGIGTFSLVNVKRGFAGTISSTHNDYSEARVYNGSFNISGNKIYFTKPPRGSARDVRDLSNLPFPTSVFAGRVFLRQDYTTNTLYDDISSDFTGIDQTYRLSVQGINTTGIETGSGVVFINGVFQTPSTENNQRNTYKLEQSNEETNIVFSGITSTNGDIVNSIFDINQNQLPRGGLIISLGSTQGLGYAPLVGASVTAVVNPLDGSIVSVGLGTTDVFGSGYNRQVSIGITDSNHTGVAATITATVGAGGTLSFNVAYPGTGYVNPIISIPEPNYENLEIIGVSRRGIGNTTDTGKNTLISISVGANTRKLPGKNSDAASLIDANKQLIAEVAVGRMLTNYPLFTIPNGNQNCIDDIVDVLESISYNLKYGGNDKVYEASKIYVDNAYLSGEETESVYAFQQARDMAIQAMRNESITINGYSTLTQYFDNTIIGEVSQVPGIYGPNDCADIASAIGSFVGIVTTAILSSSLPSKTIAPGSLFEVNGFKIERAGYGFQPGDVFRPVGLVTAFGLSEPLEQFELTVVETFTDSFAAWQFGELDYIDSIKNLQDGSRTRFPLFYKGQLLSFQKDPTNTQYPNLDLNQVLLIFVNGVIQQPGYAFQFEGGSSFVFTEPPRPDANVSIFFYRGTREQDSLFVNIQETLKIGDSVSVKKLNNNSETKNQDIRRIEDFVGSDLIQTEIYTGEGINDDVERPVDWIKQKRDLIINGDYVYKTRDSLEGQIYPTAKIIKDVNSDSSEIFVDNADLFIYEENEFNIKISKIDSLIVNNEDPVSASITAIISDNGTIESLDLVNPGYGYTSGLLDVKFSAPKSIGVGIGTTATAVAIIENGSIQDPITITNSGFGYNKDNPPQVIVSLPDIFSEKVIFERIAELVPIAKGFSGIITGITTATGIEGNPLAIKFYLRRSFVFGTFDDVEIGYPFSIFNTSVGSGLTSIDYSDSDIVGIGTEYVNNIYYVHDIQRFGPLAIITSNIHSSSNTVGIETYSDFLNPIGQFSWGKLEQLKTPVSIGVTGLTIDSGLSTFPTIQRRGFGLRDNGSLRKSFI